MTDYKDLTEKLLHIKAVVLDMDGVLVDSEPFHVQSFRVMLNELDLDYEDSFLHSFIGHSIESNIQSINEYFLKGRELNLKEAVNYRDAIYLDLIRQADLKPLSGIFELIELCKKINITLALASSSVKEQVDVILTKLSNHNWNLFKIFKSIVTGDDVEKRKPEPDIYKKTITNLNIPANQCLAIEDSPAGVYSAKAAGLNCVALKSIFIDTNALKDADLLIDNINQLTEILNKKLQ